MQASISSSKYAFTISLSVAYSRYLTPRASWSNWRLARCALMVPASMPTRMPFQVDGSPTLYWLFSGCVQRYTRSIPMGVCGKRKSLRREASNPRPPIRSSRPLFTSAMLSSYPPYTKSGVHRVALQSDFIHISSEPDFSPSGVTLKRSPRMYAATRTRFGGFGMPSSSARSASIRSMWSM